MLLDSLLHRLSWLQMIYLSGKSHMKEAVTIGLYSKHLRAGDDMMIYRHHLPWPVRVGDTEKEKVVWQNLSRRMYVLLRPVDSELDLLMRV